MNMMENKMKPYNERLPMIDESIDYYKGKLPREANPDSTLIVGAYGSYYFISEEYFNTYSGESEFVCYEEEFEQRAKELGWINGYKWGVEYKTNGEKPDLPDDTVIEIESTGGDRDLGSRFVKYNDWTRTKSFRIVDGRYKPKEQEMNNDWHEKGELPPVGEVVEFKYNDEPWKGRACKIIAYHGNEVWLKLDGNEVSNIYSLDRFEFRPLRTETDKLVEQIFQIIYDKDDYTHAAEELAKQGYRKVKPMSEDEFISEIQSELSEYRVDWASHLYRAGYRLIDKGE